MLLRPKRFRLSPLLLGCFLAAACMPLIFAAVPICCGQEATEAPAKPYSDEVVAKADKVLGEAGMKRSGKTILVTEAAG